MDEKLLTIKEVAERFGVSRVSVQNWIKDGRLPAIKIGTKIIRIRECDLAAIVAKA